MNRVTFNEFEDDQDTGRQSFTKKESFLVRLIMKISGGFVKNEKQANLILMLVIFVGLIVTVGTLLAETRPNNINPNIDPATGELLPHEL